MENRIEETESKLSLGKYTMIYGSVTGVILIIISLLFYVINVDPTSFLNYLNIAVLIFAMAYFCIQFRNTINGGFLSYGRSLGCGFLIGMNASIVLAIYTFVFFKYIDPGMIDKLLANAETKMLEQNPDLSDEQLEMGLKYSKMFLTPLAMMFWTFVGMSFWSFIFSLIVSIFTQKTDKNHVIS